jgi:FlaA1/EpsC-like NDP-sugar epimerase
MIFTIGAAGSIGSELSRQLSKKNKVVGIDQDESGLFALENVIPEIANIRNKERLDELFLKYKPSVVYHCAAYKHLSNYEKEHLEEVVLTNVIGTLNIIKLCLKYGAKLVFISTDKAVNPTSLMGTTKLLGEIMVKRCGGIVVRFGNVIGSRGSVVPIWEKQYREKKPLTITDERMRRYFMTIHDACELVIKASKIGKGGKILIFDMGEQRLITDVADELFPECKLKFIGIKQGEKLEEELMTEEEKKRVIKKGKFYII